MDTIIITVVTAVFASTGFWAFVTVYGRSRSGYYIYAPQLTIVQTA